MEGEKAREFRPRPHFDVFFILPVQKKKNQITQPEKKSINGRIRRRAAETLINVLAEKQSELKELKEKLFFFQTQAPLPPLRGPRFQALTLAAATARLTAAANASLLLLA